MRAAAHRPRPGRGPACIALGVGVCCLFAGGIPLLLAAGDAGGVRDAGAVPTSRVEMHRHDAGVAGTVRADPVRTRPAPLPPVPVRVRIARLHIDAAVIPVTADRGGALAVPDDPSVAGWWSASARPGTQAGSVVIDGHVDSASRGLGAFFRLGELNPGDRIVVKNASAASNSYAVVARRRYAKTALPAREIFAQDVAPRLVLVTCGGPFNRDTGSYLDNVVIYAVPI